MIICVAQLDWVVVPAWVMTVCHGGEAKNGAWMRRDKVNMLTGLTMATFVSGIATAQSIETDYPRKPIRIIVGFTPGGGPDITARYLAQRLTESWKQQVIVDNRPGAGGTVGANLVATANPDGHTLLSVSSAHAVAAAIYTKLPYDTRKDLSGITQTAVSKYVLLPDMPTLSEAGLPGFTADLWFGVLTSAQVPKGIVGKLNTEIRRILSDADVKQRWLPIGLAPQPTTPTAFDKIIAGEIANFATIARAANIKAE